MDPLAPGHRLGKWILANELGRGEFGRVYRASHESNPATMFALKVAPLSGAGATKTKKMSQSAQAVLLHKEFMLYNVNFKVPGCAHLAGLPKDAYGEDGCYRWIAMQLLGRTLADGLEAAGGRIGWPTVAAVAVQAVAALRYVHAKGFVYVDVNPGNLMCGRAEDGLADTLFLCDFGLTEVWRGGVGKAATENGTPLYVSVAGHTGSPLCPRNDLESVGYLLAECLGGKAALPWHAATSLRETADVKAAATPAAIAAAAVAGGAGAAAGLAPLRRYLEAVAALGPLDAIDYDALAAIFGPHAAPRLAWEGGVSAASAAGARGGPAPHKATAKARKGSGAVAAPVPAPVAAPPPPQRARGGAAGRTAAPPVVIELSDSSDDGGGGGGKAAAAAAEAPAPPPRRRGVAAAPRAAAAAAAGVAGVRRGKAAAAAEDSPPLAPKQDAPLPRKRGRPAAAAIALGDEEEEGVRATAAPLRRAPLRRGRAADAAPPPESSGSSDDGEGGGEPSLPLHRRAAAVASRVRDAIGGGLWAAAAAAAPAEALAAELQGAPEAAQEEEEGGEEGPCPPSSASAGSAADGSDGDMGGGGIVGSLVGRMRAVLGV